MDLETNATSYDPKSPLFKGLQHQQWPQGDNTQKVPKSAGNVDHKKFVMSYKAAMAVAKGDESIIVKLYHSGL